MTTWQFQCVFLVNHSEQVIQHKVLCVGRPYVRRKMEKVRHGKYNKDNRKKTSKKRKSREENGKSPNATVVTVNAKPLVEYSDVSSEDLSGPEAGEIQSGEETLFSFSDDGELSGHSMHRNSHHRYAHSSSRILEEEYYLSRQTILMGHSPSRRVRRLDPELLPRSPSPMLQRHERKTSVSSRSSRSSEVRQRRKVDSSPIDDYKQVATSPYTGDYDELERKRKKRKEKKHKKDKKGKKKKKKSKHRSRSTSVDSADNTSPSETPPRVVEAASPRVEIEREPLSDWEPPVTEPPPATVNKIDTSACSPVSNDSHIASPEPEDRLRSPSPMPITPPMKSLKDFAPRESPHTPPLLPSRSYNSMHQIVLENRIRDRSLSPIMISRDRSISRQSYSPIKSSPYRNPSPEIITIHSHHSRVRTTISPSRRRRMDREMHRRHRKEKERMKDRRKSSRSRSPRRRVSRSPSWGRRYHSRSPSRSRMSKRYKSRSPKNIRERDRSPSR